MWALYVKMIALLLIETLRAEDSDYNSPAAEQEWIPRREYGKV